MVVDLKTLLYTYGFRVALPPLGGAGPPRHTGLLLIVEVQLLLVLHRLLPHRHQVVVQLTCMVEQRESRVEREAGEGSHQKRSFTYFVEFLTAKESDGFLCQSGAVHHRTLKRIKRAIKRLVMSKRCD